MSTNRRKGNNNDPSSSHINDPRFEQAMNRARQCHQASDIAGTLHALDEARNVPGFERNPVLLELNSCVGQHCKRVGLRGFWETQSILPQEGHGVVNTIAFSPDSRFAVSASRGSSMLKLWDVLSGKCLHAFQGHTGEVYAVAISPDGNSVLSGSRDSTLRLWELKTGKLLDTLTEHTNSVLGVAFSRDGLFALSGSADRTQKWWDLSTGQCLQKFTQEFDYHTATAISPDGDIALGAWASTLNLWELATGQHLRSISHDENIIEDAAFSPDGRTLVSVGGKTIKIWDLETAQCISTIEAHKERAKKLSILSGGRFALSAGVDNWSPYENHVKLWDLISSRHLLTLAKEETEVVIGRSVKGTVEDIAFSPDGRFAAYGIDAHLGGDPVMKVFELDWEYEAYTPEELQERQQKEAQRKQYEAEKLKRKQREAEEAAQRMIQHQRISEGKCLFCGQPLGFINRLLRRQSHPNCAAPAPQPEESCPSHGRAAEQKREIETPANDVQTPQAEGRQAEPVSSDKRKQFADAITKAWSGYTADCLCVPIQDESAAERNYAALTKQVHNEATNVAMFRGICRIQNTDKHVVGIVCLNQESFRHSMWFGALSNSFEKLQNNALMTMPDKGPYEFGFANSPLTILDFALVGVKE